MAVSVGRRELRPSSGRPVEPNVAERCGPNGSGPPRSKSETFCAYVLTCGDHAGKLNRTLRKASLVKNARHVGYD